MCHCIVGCSLADCDLLYSIQYLKVSVLSQIHGRNKDGHPLLNLLMFFKFQSSLSNKWIITIKIFYLLYFLDNINCAYITPGRNNNKKPSLKHRTTTLLSVSISRGMMFVPEQQFAPRQQWELPLLLTLFTVFNRKLQPKGSSYYFRQLWKPMDLVMDEVWTDHGKRKCAEG